TPTYEIGTGAGIGPGAGIGSLVLSIAGFMNLQGNTNVDTFLVTAASTFNLAGGGGNDLFDIAAALTGTLDGGLGSDPLAGTPIDSVALTSLDANGADGTEASISGGCTD